MADTFLTPIKLTVDRVIVDIKDTLSYGIKNDDKADIVKEIRNYFEENKFNINNCKIIGSFIFGRTWEDIDMVFRSEADRVKFMFVMSELESRIHEKFHIVNYLGEEAFINIQDRFSFWTKIRLVLRLDGKLEVYNIRELKIDDWIRNNNYDIKELIYEHGWYPINYCETIKNNFDYSKAE